MTVSTLPAPPDPDADEDVLPLFGALRAAERAPLEYIAPPSTPANDEKRGATIDRESTRKPDGIAVISHIDGGFVVERVRHEGGSFDSHCYTREELSLLVAAATEALAS